MSGPADYDDQVTTLYYMLDGRHDNARMTIRRMTKEELQKLSDALDYYAVLVDEQLIRYARMEGT